MCRRHAGDVCRHPGGCAVTRDWRTRVGAAARTPDLAFSSARSKTHRMQESITTTAFTIDGYRTVKTLGVVRGIIVRSRSIVGNIGAAFQTLIGGNISIYTNLCEKARSDAYLLMVQQAQQRGANAIIGVRYDATEVMQGVTEVLCYGTALVVEAVVPEVAGHSKS